MLKKKHILFLVPDGVGIKNYLYSNVISHLKNDAKITIWSPLPIEAFDDVKRIHKIDFDYQQIILKPENSYSRIYREAATYARLIVNSKLQNNRTILTNWRRPNYSYKAKLLYRCAEVLGKYLSKKYSRILKYEKKSIEKIPENFINAYVKDLEEIKPSAIFITHQRVAGLMPICIAANKLKIKTTTTIFSWDNLPKARLAVNTDYYLVWSQWMKEEMNAYYPEISENRVLLVGTPQFEFYLDDNRIETRLEFAKQYGLDSNKKWICFSGDDITTSPYDHLFLRDIAKALYSEKDNIQIIFRRCPVDFSDRYDDSLKEYNGFIVSIDPIWNVESETGWVGFFPKYDDINMQINLAYHCDLVMNLGSTMAIDFATFNKPCLYLNYNPSDDSSWSTEIIYNFQHFRSMKGLNAVARVNDKSELLKAVLRTFESPNEIATDRKAWMQKIVLHPIDENSAKIAKVLL
ncbi:hypothetical protein H8K90_11165 [Winogradskyella echinorum]|uniref:Diacylglycerol glucosyltransferase N-terminal domain-containing protein n=1 Tax=Winogradskyella echinorum TaxID=538189 RepID=A0ABR6Y2H3_9FLAO|nr:hypothetical protein [Winogradskyella echinorum]MBC3846941.1 hypothetical protein [Winogradskyella echinorum]MBC5751289.1 hypothetical protein [Winogradskyella echinorum]